MEGNADHLENKTCELEKIDAVNTLPYNSNDAADQIEVEILPMKIKDEVMMDPIEVPFAPLVSPLQPSTSADTQRKQAETTAMERCFSQNQFLLRALLSTSRTDRAVVKSSHTEHPQEEKVAELYMTDEDVPQKLKDMISDLEATRIAKTVRQRNKRRKLNVGDHERTGSNRKISKAHVLFDGDYSALNFQWSPMSSFLRKQEFFQPDEVPGPRKPTACCYEAFRQFWDDEILENIVRETNRYGSQLSSSSSTVWIDTNKHEILILFAFWMMLGIIQMPAINSCFSKHVLLKTSIFRKLLSKERYKLLNRALHFIDDSTRRPDSSKLFCLGPIVDHLNKKFSEAYTLSQDIAINGLTIQKSPLSFKQPIRLKAGREDINFHALCESSTGYIWSFIIYSGKDPTTSPSVLPKSMEIVVQLMIPLLNKGYRLFLDNWYNTPLLARFLKRNYTDCVGTLRLTRKNIPDLIKVATIAEGSCVARHSGDVVVMAYQDNRTIYTISTCHGTESVPDHAPSKRTLHSKPAVIVDYNKSRGGVDRMDQTLEPYLIHKKRSLDWYRKLFKRLLNISILNSRIIVDRSTKDSNQQLEYRVKLVEKIMANHLDHVPTVVDQSQKLDSGPVFSTTHFVIRIEENRERVSKSRGRVPCTWCTVFHKTYKKTVYKCEQCNIPLCLKECFKAYHTKR